MPPEALELLLSKLELAGPLDSKDFLQIILGDNKTSINLSDDIRKVVLSKVTKLIGSSNLEKVFNSAAIQIQKSVDSLNSITENIKSKSKTPEPASSKTPVKKEDTSSKIIEDFLKSLGISLSTKKDTSTGSTDTSITPTLYKTKKDELELSESTIKKFAKVAGLSNKETNSLLSKLNKSVNDENDKLGLLEGYLRSKSGGFLDTLISFGKLLLLGGLSTLLLSSFGPAITGIIDRIFGTNLTGLFAPFKESLSKWQGYIDMFGKYATLFGIGLLNAAGGFKRLLGMGLFGGKLSQGIVKTSKIAKPGLIKRLSLAAGTAKTELPAMARDEKGVIRIAKGVKDAAGKAIGGRMVSKEAAAAFEVAEKAGSKGLVGKALGTVTGTLGKAVKLSGLEKIGGSLIGKIGGKLLKGIPFVGALISIGLAVKKLIDGDWIGGLFDIASALVGFIPFVGIPLSFAIDFLSAKVTDAAGGDKNKKGSVIKDFFSDLVKGFIRKFINLLPETFGIRSAAAKLFGIDIAPPNENTTFLPTAPLPPGSKVLKKGEIVQASEATPEFLKQHTKLKWVEDKNNTAGGYFENTEDETVQDQETQAAKIKNQKFMSPGVNLDVKPLGIGEIFSKIGNDIKKADIFNPIPTRDVTLPKDYDPLHHKKDNEEWDPGEAPWMNMATEKGPTKFNGAPQEQLHPELKNYLLAFNNMISDMSLNFKDYQNTMLAQAGGNSVVSINSSSTTGGDSGGFFSATRDPLFETRFAYKKL